MTQSKLSKDILIKYLDKSHKKCIASVMREMQQDIATTIVLLNYNEIEIMCNLYDYCVKKQGMDYLEFKEKFLS